MSGRTRTVAWEDPLALVAAGAGRSGLDVLRAAAAGELPPPPILALMGMSLDEVDEGRTVFSIEPGEHLYNPIGAVHGGVAATLLDSAMGCAVHTTLPAGTSYTTLELKVNYLRSITVATGPVRAIGAVLHRGRTVATAEGRVLDADDRLLAHATTTCLVLGPR